MPPPATDQRGGGAAADRAILARREYGEGGSAMHFDGPRTRGLGEWRVKDQNG